MEDCTCENGIIDVCVGGKWEWQICHDCAGDVINYADEIRHDRLQALCDERNDNGNHGIVTI